MTYYRRVTRTLVAALSLLFSTGCGLLPAFVDLGGGGVVGASEPEGFAAGPVVSLAFGVSFD